MPRGVVPVDVSAYVIDGQARYTAIWEQGLPGLWQITHGMLAPDVIATDVANAAMGLRPDRLCGFELDGQRWYAVIWRDRSRMTVDWAYEIPSENHQRHFDEMTGRGFRQVKSNGFAGSSSGARLTTVWHKPSLSSIDEDRLTARVQSVMNASSLPGFSIAFAKDGRLVYARGFATPKPRTGEAVAPGHLFRVASVSKPITAVTIFRLIEAGQLALTDTVFGPNGRLGLDIGTPPASSNVDQITIQHLLEHTSGWAFGPNADPMFLFPDLDRAGILRRLVEQEPLQTAPGASHEYENVNYLILGRVIEAITGLSYEQAVQQQVLAPAGITNMHIAANTVAGRRRDEVFYDNQGFDPYALLVDRMDAHGGWLASATDLLRFLGGIDGSPNRPQVISAGTRATMVTASTATAGYAKGWIVNAAGAYWHNGDLPGTTSIMIRGSNGFSIAILANSRPNADAGIDLVRRDFDLVGVRHHQRHSRLAQHRPVLGNAAAPPFRRSRDIGGAAISRRRGSARSRSRQERPTPGWPR